MSFTNGNGNGHYPKPKNVLGGELESCCTDPMTGFYRDGFCRTGADDTGRHTVCIEATDEFLAFSKSVGNDLSTPMPPIRVSGFEGWRQMVPVHAPMARGARTWNGSPGLSRSDA
jgi:uncharacterized protein (DUF2237 family)